ncbi:MAG: sugar-binding transcriptional regulator [Anaerolineaceae bacterium]|nr:sugar-binding transcriptional regulator [Anaerolineaceae bacterium]
MTKNYTASDHLRLMHTVAELYYLEGKTQLEIADVMGLSRSKVLRLLQEAREEGIVQISVINPFESVETLANTLQLKLGLSTVIVVAGQSNEPTHVRKRLGYAAAHYMGSALRQGTTLGIGWGRTLYEVAQALEAEPTRNLTIVPFMGGLGQITPSFQVHAMARTFSEKFGGTWKTLYAPALVEDAAIYSALMASRDIMPISTMWNEVDVALFGIGNIDLGEDVQMLFADYMTGNVYDRLRDMNAVGDICMRFFDMDGNVINNGLEHVISIELDHLKKIPHRIGVAGGAAKASAIIGAARGGFINTLITDEAAVRQILPLIED